MAANSKLAVATHIMTLIAHAQKHAEGFAEPNGLVRSDLIAGSVNTNPVVVRRLVAELAKAGLLVSHQGKGGGLELARPAEKISLLDIHLALGDEEVFAYNQNLPNPRCEVSTRMPKILKSVFLKAQHSLNENLKKTKLSDLVKELS